MKESVTQFKLDSRLQNDSFLVGNFRLSQLRLLNDKNFLWVILVPRIAGVTEFVQLSTADQLQLLNESGAVSRLLLDYFPTDKLNTAAIGNIVSQLHVHHIARRHDDPCWPGVVWGYGKGVSYEEDEKNALINTLQNELKNESGFEPAPSIE
ncbi:MAG: HIT domain-containing protein [Pseudomonadales bacterium]|nr:HIT domain-containing protein [Pseudomonadales bacterium]